MDGYIKFFQIAAKSFKDIAFFKFALPALAVIGGGVLIYFGMKGIFTQNMISLSRTPGGFHSDPIRGKAAIFTGVIYIVVGTLLAGFLGAISFYMFV